MNKFSFEVTQTFSGNNARLGVIHTPHGDIETPAFVPVGTQASVKALIPEEIRSVGTQLFFVNTYHMAMRPGIDIVHKLGGLHTFMQWNRPIITDSGGFQVFSLARSLTPILKESNKPTEDDPPKLVQINEDGVMFQSHWDGSKHLFTPEKSMEYQWKLGSDIHIAFDDCTAHPVTYEEAKLSMERTHRWAIRSLEAHKKLALNHSQPTTHHPSPYQALYGSIQGSVFQDLRQESAKFISNMEVDGIAVGGVSVGESKQEMKNVLDWVIPFLAKAKPRHLLGVGEIDDIFMLIESGMDTFDCTQPTRLARGGYLYSQKSIRQLADKSQKTYLIDINGKEFTEDTGPIDEMCHCYTCTTYSRAYIHHLFKVRELLAYRLATIHNLTFIHSLVSDIKTSLQQSNFLELKAKWV